ncbi:thioredoxin family protein [Acuticoccus sediminis]|uniref:thioredoxin family protein n=1 Tax=Acuticoccus sediminis TaxID=2184697 RepID=UPI001CFDC994|nr:thioredoxin family protein [Acuticoccus sediminis]
MSDERLNRIAPDFTLPATDGSTVSLESVRGEKGTVVAFICNHCPYVVSSVRRMVEDAKALAGDGVGFVAICANDAQRYPADSFERMKVFAETHGFTFPYLHDEDQSVARAYQAAVTPDFFGLDADGVIKYRGRMDAGQTSAPPPDAPRELLLAMRQIAASGEGPSGQKPPAGCSIKWR